MKEYVIQFFGVNGRKWITVDECRKHPFKTEDEARKELEDRQNEHPWNRYRIAVRTVTEWEEVI